MVDVFSSPFRSRLMSRVTGRNTKPEITVRKLLHRMGYRFRLHRPDLPGKPDIVLPRLRTAIFVHGCFWHSHNGCKRSGRPTTNIEFWEKKIERTIVRDQENLEALKALGWRPLVIWECQVKDTNQLVATITRYLP